MHFLQYPSALGGTFCPVPLLLFKLPGDTNHTDNTEPASSSGKKLMNWKVKTWLYVTRKAILSCLCSKQKNRVQVKGNDKSFSDFLGKQQ